MECVISYKEEKISFHDEPVMSFCFDVKHNIIKLTFERYYSLKLNSWINKECTLIVSDWEFSTSSLFQLNSIKVDESLEKNIGILIEIFSIKQTRETLQITAERLDSKIICLNFKLPKINFF
jgi:hypothetical protein